MTLAVSMAIVTGALAAWRPGGLFDRIATVLSLAGASIPNFWVAIVGVLVFAVTLGCCRPRAPARRCIGSCRSRCCSSGPADFWSRWCAAR